MNVVEWLLDSDPSIRWQVLRDQTHEPDAMVAAERSRVVSMATLAISLVLIAVILFLAAGRLNALPLLHVRYAAFLSVTFLLRSCQ